MEGTNLIQKRDFRKLLLDPEKIQANAQELIEKQRKKEGVRDRREARAKRAALATLKKTNKHKALKPKYLDESSKIKHLESK